MCVGMDAGISIDLGMAGCAHVPWGTHEGTCVCGWTHKCTGAWTVMSVHMDLQAPTNVCVHRGILVHRPCMNVHACVCVCVCGYRCAHGPGPHYLCLCNSGGPCTCVCMVSCVDVGLGQGMSVRVPLGAQAQHILKCSDMLLSLDLGVRAHVSLGAHIWHLCGGWIHCFPSPPLG